MQEINITINKANVFEEVAKTTAYIGAKKVEDAGSAYDRIFTTDADRNMIERFWRESADVITNLLKRFIVSVTSLSVSTETTLSENYDITLSLSDRFESNMTSSVSSSIFSFFVNSIVSKWCEITDKDNMKEYADAALLLEKEILEKVFFKKKPTRIKINNV